MLERDAEDALGIAHKRNLPVFKRTWMLVRYHFAVRACGFRHRSRPKPEPEINPETEARVEAFIACMMRRRHQ